MLFEHLRKLRSSSSDKSSTAGKGRAKARKKPFRFKGQLCLEGLEDRMVLSAPAPYSLGNVTVPATSQGGQVSGSYFLGGSFATGDQSVGGISSTPVGQFGAELNLNLSGTVGVDLGYSASTGGQVNTAYKEVSLQQNYSEPTQFNQQVIFSSQNTNVSYQSGSFSTTGPSVSASANLVANVSGSVGGTFAFFKAVSGSSSFSTNINQPLFNVGLGSTGSSNGNDLGLTVGVLGQDISNVVNDIVSSGSLSLSVNPAGPEVPIYISGSVNGSSNPIGLHESLSLGAGEGEGDEAIGGSIQLGSADQYAPDITLNSDSLQNGGVLSDSEQGNIADLNIQAGPVVAALLSAVGFPGGGVAALAGADTLSVGPASVTFTPISFQVGPNLSLAQTSTITPSSQLTYTFTNSVGQPISVDVTKDGQDLGLVHSVTFTAGVDNVGIKFTGTPITVTPSWTFTETYQNEVDLDVSVQGSLTAGSLSAAFGDISTPTLGPLYSQNFDFADYKIATLYNNTSQIVTKMASLPSFVIGSTFSPSLNVTQFTDSDSPGSLRGAVESADLTNSATPQIIHLGPGTYNLTISPNSSGTGSSGGLFVSAQNLIIEGAGPGQTIINAAGLGDRVFNVASGANLTLQGVTVTGGSVGFTSSGGGILNSGTLTVDNCLVTNNSSMDGGGGGIFNFGTLFVTNSRITNNSTFNNGIGNLSLGGGIGNEGQATVVNSTIDNNVALDLGGGIYNVLGNLTVINSTIEGNETASDGGGIANNGQLTMVNCTVSANSANDVGGGLWAPQFNFMSLTNTIIAGNFDLSGPDDITGPVDNNRSANNLIGDGAGLVGISNGSNGNMVGQPNALIDPRLATLGNYGGPTPTMVLLSGSPALGAGTSTVPGGLPLTDQRGLARTINGNVDIGAVEYQYDLDLSGSVTPGAVPGTVQYSYTVANSGPDPVAGTTLTVPLPQGTTLQSFTLPAGWLQSNPGVGNNGLVFITDTTSLNSGQSANFTLTVQLRNTAVGAMLSNTATVSPTISDSAPQNNSVTLILANEQEGQTFKNVLLHFTDPTTGVTADKFTASVAWGDNSGNTSNDGSGTVSVVADPNGGFDVVGAHAYAEEGNYGTTVVVTGTDGTVYTNGSQQNSAVSQPLTNALLYHFTDANIPVARTPGVSSSGGSLAATTYYYTVTSTTAAGESPSSNEVSATTTGNNSLVALSWSPVAGATGYKVYRGTSAGAENTLIATITDPKTISFTDDGTEALSSATPPTNIFTASVVWGDNSGNTSSDGSGLVSVVANPNGGFDVFGSHAYAAANSYAIAVAVTGSDGTQVNGGLAYDSGLTPRQQFTNALLYHFTDANSPVVITPTVSVGPVGRNGQGILGNATYYYTVTSTNATGESPSSNEVSATTAGIFNQITLTWNPVAGATGYKVYRGTSPGAENTLIATIAGNTLSYLDTGFEATSFASPPSTSSLFTASVVWGDYSSNTSRDGSGTVSVVANPKGGFDVLGSHSYKAVGDYGIAVTINGTDGTQANGNITFSSGLAPQQLYIVSDAPLKAGALTPPPFATINQAISGAVLFHFTDADPNGVVADYTATVTWGDGTTNSSNDGSGAVSVVANINGGFDVVGAHTYTQVVNAGTFSVQVSDAGGSSTGASVSNFQVQAPDLPLIAGALNVPSVTIEGQSISNQLLFHFSDPDTDAQASDYLTTVFWGDGSANSSNDGSGNVSVVANPSGGFDVVGSHVFVASSGADFAVKVTDLGDPRSATPDLGGQVTGAVSSAPLTIVDPPVVVTAGQTFVDLVNTLSAVQTLATFTDPGGPDTNAFPVPYIATIQWGDGTVTVASPTAQANYTNATVNNVGHVTGLISSAQNVGGIVLGSDGQTFSVNLAHEYVNQGQYTITILLNHDGVLSPTVTTTALVAGIDNLTALGSAPIVSTFGAGISNATVATFTDTNTVTTASAFIATITWGDGQSSSGTVSGSNGSFTVTGSHNYANVGSFPIGISISTVAGTATAAASTSATISPAAPTVTVSDAGGTFNGNSFPAAALAVGIDGATSVAGNFGFAYFAGNSAMGASSATAPTSAGIYTVVATFTSSDPNYMGGSSSITFTIAQATPTVSVSDSGGTFNGNAFPATATVAGIVSGVDTTPAASLEGVTPTLTYYAGNTASGTPLAGAPTQVGTYTVVASFAGSTDYKAASASVSFLITQATPTVSVTDAGGAYNGHPFPATATVAGVVSGVDNTPAASLEGVTPTLTYYAGNSASGTPLAGAPTQAGTYTVIASFAGSTDYKAASASVSFIITQATPTVSVTDAGGAYNGHPFAAIGTALGVDGMTQVAGSFTYVYYAGPSASGTPLSSAPINAGSYTVVATFASADSNYTSGGAAQTTFAISRAQISYTIGSVVQIFGYPVNLAALLPPSFNTGINGETLDIAYSSSGDTSTAHAGVYPITGVVSNGAGLATNYTVTLTSGSLTVVASGVTVVGTELWIVGGPTSNDNVQITPVGVSTTGSTGVKVDATLNGVHTSTTYNQSFTTIHIVLYAGNDNIQLAPTLTIPAIISAGNGNDNVQLDAANNTVTLGSGNDNVQAGNGNNIVTLGGGNDNFNAGNGNNAITAGNGNDNVTLGNGSNVVTLGCGNDNVNAGLGNNTVTLGNGNDNVSLGNGANTVMVGTGNDNINVGNGNNVIVEGSGNDNVNAGNGANLIVAGLGQHNVSVGNGSNIVIDGSVQLTQNGDSLGKVLADWVQYGNEAANVASIRARLAVTFNTHHANNLNAGGGLDWFWATDSQDHLNAKSKDLRN